MSSLYENFTIRTSRIYSTQQAGEQRWIIFLSNLESFKVCFCWAFDIALHTRYTLSFLGIA